MTGIAEFPDVRGEKPFVLRGMGQVAGNAPLSLRNGRMWNRDRPPLFLVTSQAETVPFPHKEERIP